MLVSRRPSGIVTMVWIRADGAEQQLVRQRRVHVQMQAEEARFQAGRVGVGLGRGDEGAGARHHAQLHQPRRERGGRVALDHLHRDRPGPRAREVLGLEPLEHGVAAHGQHRQQHHGQERGQQAAAALGPPAGYGRRGRRGRHGRRGCHRTREPGRRRRPRRGRLGISPRPNGLETGSCRPVPPGPPGRAVRQARPGAGSHRPGVRRRCRPRSAGKRACCPHRSPLPLAATGTGHLPGIRTRPASDRASRASRRVPGPPRGARGIAPLSAGTSRRPRHRAGIRATRGTRGIAPLSAGPARRPRHPASIRATTRRPRHGGHGTGIGRAARHPRHRTTVRPARAAPAASRQYPGRHAGPRHGGMEPVSAGPPGIRGIAPLSAGPAAPAASRQCRDHRPAASRRYPPDRPASAASHRCRPARGRPVGPRAAGGSRPAGAVALAAQRTGAR